MKKPKILLLHIGNYADYQNDMVFVSLLTNKNLIFDSNIYPDYLFKDFIGSDIYGRGFTMYKKLEISQKRIGLEEALIKRRIKNHYYDLIIYSSIRRFDKFFDLAINHYSLNEIICIDGEDNLNFSVKHFLNSIYFKRELTNFLYQLNIKPISFFIPRTILEELKKIYNFNLKKKNTKAYCDPNDKKTYIYENEKKYYAQYSNSLFGVTKMKGGWDCLRHYEIILCRCLPYFENIEKKPSLVMQEYPVKYQLIANKLYDSLVDKKVSDINMEEYKFLIEKFQKYQEKMSNSFGSFELKNIIFNKKDLKMLVRRNKNILWILFLKTINIFLLFKWIIRQSYAFDKNNPIKRLIFSYYLFKDEFKKYLGSLTNFS